MIDNNYRNTIFSDIYTVELPEDVIHVDKYNQHNVDLFYSSSLDLIFKPIDYKILHKNFPDINKPFYKILRNQYIGRNMLVYTYTVSVDSKQINICHNKLKKSLGL